MKAPLLIATAILGLSAALSACGDAEEEAVDVAPSPSAAASSTPATSPSPLAPTPVPAITPGPGVTLWRWDDLTVLIPEGLGVRAAPEVIESQTGAGQGVRIIRDTGTGAERYSWMLLDASTGEKAQENVLPEDRSLMDAVLATVAITPLDEATAAWPYDEVVPDELERQSTDGFSYLIPPPSTGLQFYLAIGDPGGPFIGLRNGRSQIIVSRDPATDKLAIDSTHVAPEDEPVMRRWAVTVQRCEIDVAC
jgi:hypothetical protein